MEVQNNNSEELNKAMIELMEKSKYKMFKIVHPNHWQRLLQIIRYIEKKE